jgi:hypothetical protein
MRFHAVLFESRELFDMSHLVKENNINKPLAQDLCVSLLCFAPIMQIVFCRYKNQTYK